MEPRDIPGSSQWRNYNLATQSRNINTLLLSPEQPPTLDSARIQSNDEARRLMPPPPPQPQMTAEEKEAQEVFDKFLAFQSKKVSNIKNLSSQIYLFLHANPALKQHEKLIKVFAENKEILDEYSASK